MAASDLFYATVKPTRRKPAPGKRRKEPKEAAGGAGLDLKLDLKRKTKQEEVEQLSAKAKEAGRYLATMPASKSELAKAAAAEAREAAESANARAKGQSIKMVKQQAMREKREFPLLRATGMSIGPAPPELVEPPFAVRVSHMPSQLQGKLYGTLEDPSMAPSKYDEASPATRGYIKFPVPIINPIHMRTVIGILKVVCKSCFHLLVEGPELEQVMTAPASSRLAMLEALLDKQGESTQCPIERSQPSSARHPMVEYLIAASIGSMSVQYRTKKNKKRLQAARAAQQDEEGQEEEEGEGGKKKRGRKPKATTASCGTGAGVEIMETHMIQTILSGLTDDTTAVLGFTRESILAMIIPGIVVPPLEVRPPKNYKNLKNPGLDEISKSYVAVLAANTALADAKRRQDAGEGDGDVSQKTIQLSAAVAKLFQWILSIFSGKEGLGRSDTIGKRLDLSARGVIGPGDEYLEVNWIGVPEFLTNTLGRLETATPQNISMLRELLRLGMVVKVFQRETGFIKNVTPEAVARGAVHIAIGDEVHRKLMHGDWVIDMRAPVIHRHSVVAHRVRIVNQNSFQMPISLTPQQNADFDGDEETVTIPTSDRALYEAEHYLSFQKNMMSSQSGKPVTGLVQNSILFSMMLTESAPPLTLKYLTDASQRIWGKEEAPQVLASLQTRVLEAGLKWPSPQALYSVPLPAELDYIGPKFRIEQGVLVEGVYDLSDLHHKASFYQDLLTHYSDQKVQDLAEKARVLVNGWQVFAPAGLTSWEFSDAISSRTGLTSWLRLSEPERAARVAAYNAAIVSSGIMPLSYNAYLSLALPPELNYQSPSLEIQEGVLVRGKLPDPLPPALVEAGVQASDISYLKQRWQNHQPSNRGGQRVPRHIFEEALGFLTERAQLPSFNYRIRSSGIHPLSGNAFYSMLLPADFEYSKGAVRIVQGVLIRGTITKADVGPGAGAGILHKLIIDYPGPRGQELGARFLTDANRILNFWGRFNTHTVGLDAVSTVFDPWVESERTKLYQKLEEQALNPDLTDQQILEISDAARKLGPRVATYERERRILAGRETNALHVLVDAGAKGSMTNVNAVHSMQGMLTDSFGMPRKAMSGGERLLSSFRPGETSLVSRGFVPESFGLGLSANSAFLSAMSGRETLITDIASIGDLHRKVGLAFQDIVYANASVMDTSSGMVYQFGPYGGDGFDVTRTIKIGGRALPFDPAAAARRINALAGWFYEGDEVEPAARYQRQLEEEEEEVEIDFAPYQSDFAIPTNERLFTDAHGIKHRLVYPVYGDKVTPATLIRLGEPAYDTAHLDFPISDLTEVTGDVSYVTPLVHGEIIDI